MFWTYKSNTGVLYQYASFVQYGAGLKEGRLLKVVAGYYYKRMQVSGARDTLLR